MLHASLALFYALKLALLGGDVYEWQGDQPPRLVMRGAVHVAVSSGHGHAVDAAGRAWRWKAGERNAEIVLEQVAWLAAGESALLAIRTDGSLWQRRTGEAAWSAVAPAAAHGSVGDSSDYYIDSAQQLFVRGAAHRGQYGTGQLTDAPGWVPSASGAVAVAAHTGHAIFLRQDGRVMGTGGNRFGPLGHHGYGDKADRWGVIFEGATQIATGSRHTVAIKADGTLWSWGAADGLQPRQVMDGVAAVAAGDMETIARRTDGTVWQWAVGQAPRQVVLPRPAP